MLRVHHLDNSRSQRVLWLLEELALHYAEGSAMLPVMLRLYTSRLGEAGAPLQPAVAARLQTRAGARRAVRLRLSDGKTACLPHASPCM